MEIVALGECLIDFTPAGCNELGMQLFSRNPGGAPANVLAMAAKLGVQTAFIGKVGQDAFGNFLEGTLRGAGIDVSSLCRAADVPTTLAFVQLDERGDRSFSFYRKPGADVCLTPSEVPLALVRGCRIFHFGSVSLTDEPSRAATLYAARQAKEAGVCVSYDPNYRPPLWKSESEAVEVMREALRLADVVKTSDEEMTLLTGETELSRGAEALAQYGARLVTVTRGEKGAYFRTPTHRGDVAAYRVAAADTTGAGDAFWGAVLAQLLALGTDGLACASEARLTQMIRYANAAGGLTATGKGAIPAMPDEAAILRCIREQPLNQ